MSQQYLNIRQHQRVECALPGHLAIAPSCSHLRLSNKVADESMSIPVTLVDVAPGGMGLHSQVYLPRLCAVRLIVQDGYREWDFSATVRRTVMINHAPNYLVGVLLSDPDEQAHARITELIEHAKTSWRNAGGRVPGDA